MEKRAQEDWDKQIAKHEISARKSLIFDTGTVHWTTSFEDPVYHLFTTGTAGYTVTLSTNYAFMGSTSLKITPDNTANAYVQVKKYTGMPESEKVGIECNISFPSTHGEYFLLGIWFYTGAVAKICNVRYDIQNQKWQYRNSAGAYIDVTDGDQKLQAFTGLFHHIKLIADIKNETYVKLYCNQKIYDLTDIGVYTFASGSDEMLIGTIQVSVDAAAFYDFYLDDMTITEETM